MAKKVEVYSDGQLDAAAKALDYLAERLRRLNGLQIFRDGTMPLAEIVDTAAQGYYETILAFAPEWTGLLKSAHIITNPRGFYKRGFAKEQVDIVIDPNVTTEHMYLGDIPSNYGPRYARETRDWFQEGYDAYFPIFEDLVGAWAEQNFDNFWTIG